MEIDGRVALVTGGASGLGEATVRHLHRGGAHGPTFDGGCVPSMAPATTFAQLRTAAVRSRPPHASAVRSLTATAGLSSAEVV